MSFCCSALPGSPALFRPPDAGRNGGDGIRTHDPETVNPCQQRPGDTPEQGCCSDGCTRFAPDPDLARVVSAWSGLTPAQRRAVLGIIGGE
jgi:hypothetical protein